VTTERATRAEHIANHDAQSPARDKQAVTLTPDCSRSFQELLSISDMAELAVAICAVLFQIPVWRGGYNQMHISLRDELRGLPGITTNEFVTREEQF